MYLRLTGFDSLHLGTITWVRGAGREEEGCSASRLCPLFFPSARSSQGARGVVGKCLSPQFQLHSGILEKAGLGGRLTECLQFQEQQAEDRIHFPPSGRPGWNAMGGRQLGLPADHPAGCLGPAVGPGGGGGNVFMSRLIPRDCFVRMGEGAFICEVQSTLANFLC